MTRPPAFFFFFFRKLKLKENGVQTAKCIVEGEVWIQEVQNASWRVRSGDKTTKCIVEGEVWRQDYKMHRGG